VAPRLGPRVWLALLPRVDRQSDPVGWRQIGAGFVFGEALFLAGHGGLAWAQQTVPSGVAAF
jgi:hypothetical protein